MRFSIESVSWMAFVYGQRGRQDHHMLFFFHRMWETEGGARPSLDGITEHEGANLWSNNSF